MADDFDDHSGRRLGEFLLRERIGVGGFGAVYRCDRPLLGRNVVVKVLHCRLQSRDAACLRFEREAQLASQLDHPYAAYVHRFGVEPDGLLWIAMEQVHGITLKDWLRERGPMALEQLVRFIDRVAEVVQSAHERGIVHRDIKPANIMVVERAGKLSPKLLDFGIAKVLDEVMLPEHPHRAPLDSVRRSLDADATAPFRMRPSHGIRGRLTGSSIALGTPEYMAPEQWTDPLSVGPASDLYALGVVAYEALTGQPPFTAQTAEVCEQQHCRAPVPPLGPRFSPELDAFFQRALAKRPEDRHESALELAAQLRFASGISVSKAALPRIDQGVYDAWLDDAPQPLAESLAELHGARNPHQARDAIQELARTLLRYLTTIALAVRVQAREDDAEPALLELLRALRQRELTADERVRLLRLVVRPAIGRRGSHPIPELVDLVTTDGNGGDGLELFTVLLADHAASSDDVMRARLTQMMRDLEHTLRRLSFVLDYLLVLPRRGLARRWTGKRRPDRVSVVVRGGELVDHHPTLLDRDRRARVDLWPLMQAASTVEHAEPELFILDHGAQLVGSPAGLTRQDPATDEWLQTHVLAEIESKARMREAVMTSARQWHDRARTDGLLWRGDALADLDRWTRLPTAVALGEVESAFVEASRAAWRRVQRRRGALVALGVAATLSGVVLWLGMQARVAQEEARAANQLAALKSQAAEQLVTQAEVERGRAHLLHDELGEAQCHLGTAWQRGERSPATAFMLARALQPRVAELARFSASSGRMWSGAWSPDGKRVVTTDDKSAQIWDATTHQRLALLPHDATVFDAVWGADGATIVTAAGDGAVRVWSAATGASLRELRAGTKPLQYFVVATSGSVVAAIDAQGEIAHVWDLRTGELVASLVNEATEYPALAFSADGRWLATSGGEPRVFDTRTWTRAVTLRVPRVRALSWDPTASRIATGAANGDVSIWDVPSGTRVKRLREGGEPVDAIAYAPGGERLVTADRGGVEQVWDASGRLQSQLNRQGRIYAVELDATASRVLAAGGDGKVVVSDAASGMILTILSGPNNSVRTAHFNPSGEMIVGAAWDGTARIWDAIPPYLRWSSPPITDDCGIVASLEPDRRFIAVGCYDHSTRVWDTAQNRLLAELPGVEPLDGEVYAFPAVSAAGDRVAIARGSTVGIYAVPGAELLRTVKHEHDSTITAVAFAPTGHDLVTGAIDGSLMVHGDRETAALPPSAGAIDAVSILADGRIVAADAKQRLRIISSQRSVAADLEMPARAMLLRPSPDERSLVTVASYMVATAPTLWDLGRNQLVAQLHGHVAGVRSARWTNATELLTAGDDGTARRWDNTGRLLQTYRGSSRFLADAALSPDGSMVAAGGAEGVLRFWDAGSGLLLWILPAHKSHIVGLHFEGADIVTRGFGSDISRWVLPSAQSVIEGTIQRSCDSIAR